MTEENVPDRERSEQAERTVLIVDDEAPARLLLRTALKGVSVPCKVMEAVSAESALEIARKTRPDLVLLDIVLPGSSVSGVMVCQELCKDLRTKVVVVSGAATDSIVQACLSMGALEHVRKPFSVEEMQRKMEEWLAD